ncbi:PAS-domain containing protein [Pseudoroseicyclus sp. H15]
MFPLTTPLLSLLAAAGLVGFLFLLLPGAQRWPRSLRRRSGEQETATFLFERENLIDASSGAAEMMPPAWGSGEDGSDLRRVVAALESRFTGIGEVIEQVAPGERRRLDSALGDARAELARWGNRLRVSIIRERQDRPDSAPGMNAAMEELEILRTLGDAAPLPIWKVDRAGRVSWANSAYLALCDMAQPAAQEGGRDWPPPNLFGHLSLPTAENELATSRSELALSGASRAQTFDVTLVRRGGELLGYATDVTETAIATQARAEFVQTLSKTFAQLAIGLAIVDRQRRLMIFNPAFTDLTGLSVSYLSGKPTLASLLDRLRDKRMLPEPKNYRSWRERLTRVESEAREGVFGETWVLPSGQTLRVTGRPHPDGALAFLFEDITGEIALTRHFREEMDLAQAVLDRSEEGLAVFTAGGRLSLANEAYEDIWGAAETRLSELVFSSEMERWRQAAPSAVWDRLKETAESREARRGWVGQAKRRDGCTLRLRVEPLPAGALLVGFLPITLAEGPRLLPRPDKHTAPSELELIEAEPSRRG